MKLSFVGTLTQNHCILFCLVYSRKYVQYVTKIYFRRFYLQNNISALACFKSIQILKLKVKHPKY